MAPAIIYFSQLPFLTYFLRSTLLRRHLDTSFVFPRPARVLSFPLPPSCDLFGTVVSSDRIFVLRLCASTLEVASILWYSSMVALPDEKNDADGSSSTRLLVGVQTVDNICEEIVGGVRVLRLKSRR